MNSVITLLVALTLSLLVNRIATVMLTHTGLSRDSARFQSRSALTGVGFTTRESEAIVDHPVRRRILMALMLIGNAGIITVMATLVIAFAQPAEQTNWPLRVGVLASGLAAVWFVFQSAWVDRYLSRLISWALRRFTRLDVRDYLRLLHLADDYAVSESRVQQGDWIEGRTLAELDLPKEGVLALGINRSDGGYVGVPTGDSEMHAGDTVILYGPAEQLEELDSRQAGHSGDTQRQEAEGREAERAAEQERDEAARRRHRETGAPNGPAGETAQP